MIVAFKIPELGENITSGQVTSVLVSVGDTIGMEQSLLELETDKAVIDIPSPISGTIKEIMVREGQEVSVGQEVLKIETAEKLSAEKEKAPEESAQTPEINIPETTQEAANEQESAPIVKTEPQEAVAMPKKRGNAPASPSTRRFAREIGIDIDQVPGSGPAGRISVDDVKGWARSLNKQRDDAQSVFRGIQSETLPDFEKWGEVERKKMTKIRQTTAAHLSYAWATIPHVTQHDKADITHLEQLRKKYSQPDKEGGKLTMTAIMLKIVAIALKKFPQFNASIDMLNKEIIYKNYYNIGVAVDTEHGLLVPVIRNVDRKNIRDLASELNLLSQKARQRKLSIEEMQGGNFSISNLGGIGGTSFTPIVNAPEVAILGVSRAEMQQLFTDGAFEARLILPLSLSYDHRLIDGADGARFLRFICTALEEPFLLSL